MIFSRRNYKDLIKSRDSPSRLSKSISLGLLIIGECTISSVRPNTSQCFDAWYNNCMVLSHCLYRTEVIFPLSDLPLLILRANMEQSVQSCTALYSTVLCCTAL